VLEAEFLRNEIEKHEDRLIKLEKCVSSVKAELRINTMITIAILTTLLTLVLKVIS